MLSDAIVASIQSDYQTRIAASQPNGMFYDFINRVQLEILRITRWKFLLSPRQTFVTQYGVSDYWIGLAGQNPPGTLDTGLNLNNVQFIYRGQVFDRSNFRSLSTTLSPPLMRRFERRDGSSAPSPPRMFSFNGDNPGILSLYPAPDNNNAVQPVPDGPILATVAGGALPARTYSVAITYLDATGGESSGSEVSEFYISAGRLLTVQTPQLTFGASGDGIAYTDFGVYASSGTAPTFQAQAAMTATWAEPVTGIVAGGRSLPQQNTIAPVNGYVIEFRYFQQRQTTVGQGQTLQIPDDYLDVVVAGVNLLCARYLKETADIEVWNRIYLDGQKGMIRDRNLYPTWDNIGPDPASVGYSFAGNLTGANPYPDAGP